MHQGMIAAGGHDRLVYVWLVGSAAATTLKGHTLGVTGVAFAPDGKRLVSGARDRKIIVWDVPEVEG
jgi:WD40 repeat protein